MRPLNALLLAVLVGLAGCGGYGLGVTGSESTPTPEGTPDVVAPGVDAGGVTDASRLARAHADSLADRSYTVRTVRAVTWADGDRQGRHVTVLRVGADGDYRLEYRSVGDLPDLGPQPNVSVWSNGTATFVRKVDTGDVVYRRYPADVVRYVETVHGTGTVRTYLSIADEARVRQIEYGGWIAYRIAGDGGNRSVTAVVDTFGFVHELNATVPADRFYEYPVEGRGTFELAYSNVSATVVDAPGWLPEAKRITRNQTYVGQG